MKKMLLLLIFTLISSKISAQELTPSFLEGVWETEFHEVEFSGLNKDTFGVCITIIETREDVDVIDWYFEDNNLYMNTHYTANDWWSSSKMVILDENTVVADVQSDYPGILIYRRKIKQ